MWQESALGPNQPVSRTPLDGLDPWLAELRDRALRTDGDLKHVRDVIAQSRGERLDSPSEPMLVVMLCGPTAVGKSTLINTLAGSEISQRGLGATTSAAVLYVHESDDPQRLFEYGKDMGQLAQQAQTVVRHRQDALRHKVLVDTPDIDSVMRDHRELTAALVHAADLVLFVTTPQRAKDWQAAQWVREQSAQRAMAFILNQWDRASIGMQWDRRHLIEEEFRRDLKNNGFGAPLIFKTSCLGEAADATPGAGENRLPALRDWLERRLDSSVSAAIQDRRRLMAWGRLAAAIAPNIPAPIESEPWVVGAFASLAAVRVDARRLTGSAVAECLADINDTSLWPSTPGLFGIYAKFLTWCGAAATRIRAWSNPLSVIPTRTALPVGDGSADASEPMWPTAAFGGATARVIAEAIRKLRFGLNARRLPVTAVEAQWEETAAQLPSRIAALPSVTWADLLVSGTELTFRRVAGIAALLLLEVLIGAVLAAALWRISKGFVGEEYVSLSLLYNAAALVVLLILGGHVLANLFFPSLRRRFRIELMQRLDALINETGQSLEQALRQHVEAINRLAERGRQIQDAIDREVQKLKQPADTAAIDALFADQNGGQLEARGAGMEEAGLEVQVRRRAKFE
jgi:energy-coupling factor transporter ATP-binding protein EcfA2